ncbi:MAG TPA: hypothetical protein VLK89_03760 [Solirubrobacterales bacterium]|nr:hypothetical protein [Solirubrobacterales bacterium]
MAAALLAIAALVTIAAPGAIAGAVSDEEELTQFGSVGSGPGQLKGPGAIATDPVTGHVYISEEGNNRISEFTPWGNFVKAFGWDVSPGAVNEQQEVRVRAATGQFKLEFKGKETTDLAFNAPGAESEGPGSVEAALNALPSIGGESANVSVSAVPGIPDGKTPYIYVVAFKGSLAGTNAAQITIANGTTPLGGGVPSSSLEVRTRAEGTAGGTGLESCTEESGCKEGLRGAGAGEFNPIVGSVAVDANGNVYVTEIRENHRVQKFDSAGRFLLMFGGEVDKTTNENICTKAQLEGGDECGIGTVGTGPGQFAAGNHPGIAIGTGGALFVADNERIQRFNLAGEFQASIPVPGKSVSRLAFDPVSGDLYAWFEPETGIHKLNPVTGEEVGELGGVSGHVATDPAGNVYATGTVGGKGAVLQFDSAGKPLSPPSCCVPAPTFSIEGLGPNAVGDLYVANRVPGGENFIRLFGPGPVSFEGAAKVPPTISAQFASSVGRDDATVAADINPHFWSNTRYYVQYGTGKCSEGGCEEAKPLAPGAILTTKVLDAELPSAGIFLEGLKPGTTYHYRFVAQSSGGGPVRGVGGKVGADGEESTFTTYPAPAPFKTDCQNQVFRTGFSAPLTDCRAFEMVSPIDKNGGDIKTQLDLPGFNTSLSQSAENGERFTYSSYRSFGASQAAPYTAQYLATRDPKAGWSSEGLDPAQASRFDRNSFETHYKAFSADLCSGWSMVAAEPTLATGAPPGYIEPYRRDNCGGGGYEALVQVEPKVVKGAFFPILEGTSADGKEAILTVEDKLTEDATGGWQTYYASEGELHLVCILPSGLPSGGRCSAGTGPEQVGAPIQERMGSLTRAISRDGSKVYWTDSADKESGSGKVYLRLNPGKEQSEVSGGECTEAEKACTVGVSETQSALKSRFWVASSDGSRALFTVTEGAKADNLYEFIPGSGSSLIAREVLGVAGAGEDLSRIYFVAEEASAEAIVEGAVKGEPNLYLNQEGTKTFIATLSEADAGVLKTGSIRIPSDATSEAAFHAARATADGRVLTFLSTEDLSGYDNTDLANGKADSEVYLYEAGSGGPVCVSCNPSGARPTGRVIQGTGTSSTSLATAGSLAMPENQLYSPHVLSPDGRRLFFNSYDALLPRDTNGKEDVYEWESAPGQKACEEKGAELYVASSGGCLSLISSGESPSDSQFLDASSNGDDIFLSTASSLLSQDPGLTDIYDARANGGLSAPPAPASPCQGEACQNSSSPPNDPTPGSASFRGAGNATTKPRGRCPKGKARRKGRCTAKKQKHAAKRHKGRHAANNRRAAR